MIQVMTVGMLQEHTYFFIDDETKHGFIIDPGAEAETLLAHIEKEGFVIEKILLTHGHFDHIGAATRLRDVLKCPIVIHTEGKVYLENADWNLSSRFDKGFTFEADTYVEHGDKIVLEANPKMCLRTIYAPGHTADGVAYYAEAEKVAFVGDIIFEGAIGRSDHPGGNMNRLVSAIRAQIFTLPNDTMLCPGHGNYTTVRKEKDTNPYFNLFDE